MILELEDVYTGESSFWGYASQRGLLARAYDRGVARGPSVEPEGWQVYGTGLPAPVEATVRLTLAKGRPPVAPATQAEARARYAELAAWLRPGRSIVVWLCSLDGERLLGRRVLGASLVELRSEPGEVWYMVEASLSLSASLITCDLLVTDGSEEIGTDAGEELCVASYT